MLEVIQSDHNLVGEALALALLLGVAALSLAGMRRGYRRRRAAARDRYGELAPVPAPAREPDGQALYTGTTRAGSRVERVALPELWGRWRCDWWADAGRVVLRGPGGRVVALDGIVECGLVGAHAGRAVGRGRIAVVRWRLGGHEVDTGLQFASAEEALGFTARIEAAREGQRHA
ncbi:MAG TPA: hypothetical protein VNU01_04240 [Egibacteraceae bacterium]|nr:hypothetical protein [Egibacteraceae bacterium]